MSFFIQASNPIVGSDLKATEDDLREAIEDIFVMDTEDAILNWNGVPIALSYKYDISVIVDDLIEMLSVITSSSVGEHSVSWPSNTFRASWRLTWGEGLLTCAATWHSVSGGVEELLAQTGSISMPTADFLAEWRAPLERVIGGLRKAGYRPEFLAAFDQAQQIARRLERPGRLYGGSFLSETV